LGEVADQPGVRGKGGGEFSTKTKDVFLRFCSEKPESRRPSTKKGKVRRSSSGEKDPHPSAPGGKEVSPFKTRDVKKTPGKGGEGKNRGASTTIRLSPREENKS